jgi:HD-GYP domain-containing protein (c-di-GMP phosphodiesterase class II)
MISLANKDGLGAMLDRSDEAFIPARAECFMSGEPCFFDVYVRLRPGRFVMLLKAGTVFAEERLVAYLKRGVHTFFLRKEAQEAFMAYCDRLVAEHHRRVMEGLARRGKEDFNLGEMTLRVLKVGGVPLPRLARAVEFFQSLQELAHNIGLLEREEVRLFVTDKSALRHGAATAMMAHLLMEALDFTSLKLRQTVGLGALLHDIGVEEGKSYHQHPARSARILGETGFFPDVILQGIEQHHERRNRLGFPRSLGAGAINRIAEIIGFADEFVHIVQESALDPAVDPIFAAKVRLADGFSSEVLAAFEAMFWLERPETL